MKQYYIESMANASYLLGDEISGIAAVVDPRREMEPYVQDAHSAGMQIKHVILTHFHTDFVSGHLDFRDQLGAEIHIGAKAITEYQFTPAHDGDVLELGSVHLRFLETPGHTPESICIVVTDSVSERPAVILTGDTLAIGDIGRPDMLSSEGVDAVTLAGLQYDSLRNKLLALPDDTLVCPAHALGSHCGPNVSTDTFSILGTQRIYNHGLQDMTKDSFINMTLHDQPGRPNYQGWDAVLNKRELPFVGRSVTLQRLWLNDFLVMAQRGAQILDVRDPVDFAAGHLPGAISAGLDGAFEQWVGLQLDPDKPVAIVVYPGGEDETVARMTGLGLKNVIGFLSSGMGAAAFNPEVVETTVRITARNLADRLCGDEPPTVIDVRTIDEWHIQHIEGSLNIPLEELKEQSLDFPRDRSLVLQCSGGYRSSVAASVLERAGMTNFMELTGGIQSWQASALRTVTGNI